MKTESAIAADSTFATRRCPQCGGATVTAGDSVSSPRVAESLTLGALKPYWHGFFKDKMFFSYRRCSGCAQLYSPSYFTDDQLEVLYAEMAANMDVVDASALERTASEYAEVLRRFSPMRGTFLEIGPDVGAFAAYCAAKGDFSEFRLFEPNEAVHGQLRAALGANQQVELYFTRDSVPPGSVDVAAMIHVLDHVLDPVTLADDVRRTLKIGGCLVLVTHDERSLLARILRGRWPAYCLQHPQLFNRKTISKILKRAGYSNVVTVSSTNYFPVTFLIQQLALALKLTLPKLPELPWLRVGLRLGNFITIAKP